MCIANDSAALIKNASPQLSWQQRLHSEVEVARNRRGFLHQLVGRSNIALHKSRRHQIRRQNVASEIFHLILLGKEDLPLQQINRDIHARQGNVRPAFLGEGCARMQKYKRNCVRVRRPKTGPQPWNPVAVGTFNGLDLFAGNIRRQNARTRRQCNFQEWLCLVLNDQLYLRKRLSFRRDQSSDNGILRNGSQNATVGKAYPFQS